MSASIVFCPEHRFALVAAHPSQERHEPPPVILDDLIAQPVPLVWSVVRERLYVCPARWPNSSRRCTFEAWREVD